MCPKAPVRDEAVLEDDHLCLSRLSECDKEPLTSCACADMWLGDAYAPAPGPGGAETVAIAAAAAPAAPDVVQNPLTNLVSSLLVGRRLSEGEDSPIPGMSDFLGVHGFGMHAESASLLHCHSHFFCEQLRTNNHC